MTLLLLAAGCDRAPSPTGLAVTPTSRLVMFETPTPSPIPIQPTPALAATLTPLPSATPFSYVIAPGDTLLAIAFRFGVSMEEILRVNPGIDPGFLTIGAPLVIPLGEAGSGFLPTPTPVPLIHGAAQCHPTPEGDLWCFVPVLNENSTELEAVRGHVDIYNAEGELISSQTLESPLNIIPPGESLPMSAYFPGIYEEGLFARGFIEGAFLANNTAGRYFESIVEVDDVTISEAKDWAYVTGGVTLTGEAGDLPAEVRVTVAAIAYGPSGEVAGLRVWEMDGPLSPGVRVPFSITIYSLGPEIERVEILAEIRPSFPQD
ncbi:MAG TPA: LysM peptidoglycan-binding domain-containing protein [Anaerolineales bacterium]|nr:LysM peptidoglycan-binding domain-containing protein [Anaerolineales bacterium]